MQDNDKLIKALFTARELVNKMHKQSRTGTIGEYESKKVLDEIDQALEGVAPPVKQLDERFMYPLGT